jgi:hypothetical protein
MKRIYWSTTVGTGQDEVVVRQVLGYGDAAVPGRIHRAARTARRWLGIVVNALETTERITADQALCFGSCFQFDPKLGSNREKFRGVQRAYLNISSGLARPFAVKVRDMNPGVAGHVRATVLGDAIRSAPGEIHVSRHRAGFGADEIATTLIHEAGHKFAFLRDFGREGYFAGTREPVNLPWQQAIFNADSYAEFARSMRLEDYTKKRARRYKRESTHAEDADLADAHLAILFGDND